MYKFDLSCVISTGVIPVNTISYVPLKCSDLNKRNLTESPGRVKVLRYFMLDCGK
jgi:hypothetical protein